MLRPVATIKPQSIEPPAALTALPTRPRSTRKTAVPEVWVALDLDRQRAVVYSLVEAVVVANATRRGEPCTPERLKVVWR